MIVNLLVSKNKETKSPALKVLFALIMEFVRFFRGDLVLIPSELILSSVFIITGRCIFTLELTV